jgi:hypothetical protein
MKKPLSFLLFASFAICSTTTKIVAIDKKQAHILTAVGGISSMITTEILLEYFKRHGHFEKNNKLTNLGISASVGLLGALITHSILSRYTPEGKASKYIFECKNINNVLSKIEKDPLLSQEFSGDEDLLAATLIKFDNRFPLYLAKVYLEEKARTLKECVSSLNNICAIYQNLLQDPECINIFQNYRNELEKRLELFGKKILLMLEKIIQHPQYKNHVIEYKGTNYFAQLNRIRSYLDNVQSGFLMNTKFDSPVDFLVKVTNLFGTNWPLVIAREQIIGFARKLNEILVDLSRAEKLYQDLQNDTYCKDQFENCQQVTTVFYDLIKKIEELQKLVLTHPAYTTQVELYENYQRHKYEMEIKQKELANQVKLQEYALANQQKIQELSVAIENQKKEIQQVLDQNKHLQSIIDSKKLVEKGNQRKIESCSICQENYHSGEVIGILGCGHSFHKDCVSPWLNNYQKTCPLCRAENAYIQKQEVVQ